ncbi:pyridoxamine 5'-phosphate oxidase family protein [Thalassobacillus pellis]|uniref:pyridoxamine 5'-phosphate oxidase family protein n=1 Tax=Thalassobacillus pellis TaxID=748008 RepID=UPI00195FD960|nr:pyridoxamine 5'-phosphate oxidase family protein [Thalassobacillus pellis]MBM7554313.1 general stress protein 26 [Thalassobacillus pellis]
MNEQELKDKIMKILESNQVGTLASVKNNRPHSRFMTFFNEGTTFYTPTSRETHKAEEIDANPYVHILIGYGGEGFGDAYLEVEGKAVIKEDQELKEKLWNEYMENWFEGPSDPEYIVLEIEPEQIRLMNAKEKSPQTLKL